MKIVVGLGNPGSEYEDTRHNLGFEVVEKLHEQMANGKSSFAEALGRPRWQMMKKFNTEVCDLGQVKLVKPQTFMNRSGVAVRKIVGFYKVDLEDVYVVHDDLDLVMGEYKIGLGKGPKVHNGVNSVVEQLGSGEFWRVRVGVDGRAREDRTKFPGEKYVLMKINSKDRKIFEEMKKRLVEELRAQVLD